MALAGAITQLALYGGIGLPYPTVEAPTPDPEPTPTIGGPHGGGDRTRYGWVQPTRRVARREGVRDSIKLESRAEARSSARTTNPTPIADQIVVPPADLAPLAGDPAEEELLLQVMVLVLGGVLD